MLCVLGRAASALKREGPYYVARKLAHEYLFSFLAVPVCRSHFSAIRSSNIDEIVKEAFEGCCRYIAPFQVESEICMLLAEVKKLRPRSILEIGTAKGGTLFLFSRVVPRDACILSVDMPGGGFGGGYPWWKIPLFRSFALDGQELHLIRSDSHREDTREKVESLLDGRKLDFAFIDGDHTYEGVRKDFNLYSSLVREGGLVAFHDIAPDPFDPECAVYQFWNEIKKKYRHQEFVQNCSQGWAGIGIIKME